MKRRYIYSLCALLPAMLLCGCGYTTRSMVGSKYKTIAIELFKSSIDITSEPQANRGFTTYRPALETDITKKVKERFLFDGNFRIAREDEADVILKGKLTDYRKDAVRYDAQDNVEEYRVSIGVTISLMERADKKPVWSDQSVVGEYTFFLAGPNAKPEDTAVNGALDDLARRVVERTVEFW
jgi:hypothetical protein